MGSLEIKTVAGKFISAECNSSIKRINRHPVTRSQSAKIKERREWEEAWSNTAMDYTKNRIFIDESAFWYKHETTYGEIN